MGGCSSTAMIRRQRERCSACSCSGVWSGLRTGPSLLLLLRRVIIGEVSFTLSAAQLAASLADCTCLTLSRVGSIFSYTVTAAGVRRDHGEPPRHATVTGARWPVFPFLGLLRSQGDGGTRFNAVIAHHLFARSRAMTFRTPPLTLHDPRTADISGRRLRPQLRGVSSCA